MAVPAIFVATHDNGGYGFEPGQVWDGDSRIFVTCPKCGQRYALPKPPFIFDASTNSIGPASIWLKAEGCGYHGYMHNGIWSDPIDSCVGQPRQHCYRKDD